MKEVVTEIEINAPPERVWEILTDFAAWGKWNPFLYRVIGEANLGTQVRTFVKALGRETKLNCHINTLEPNRELRWEWHLLGPGLYRGEHSFSIEPLEGNRVKFVNREVFSGLLVPLFRRSINRGTPSGFKAMDQALKERAEQA
jgi:hypothetical protein